MPIQQFVDDQELVNLYIKGDESALVSLITRHKRRIFSYIMLTAKDRALAEDIFQDTFIKVMRDTQNPRQEFTFFVVMSFF